MLYVLKLYLTGCKINYRDTNLIYRSFCHKLALFMVIGTVTFMCFLATVSGKRGIAIFLEVTEVPLFLTVLWLIIVPLLCSVLAEGIYERVFRDSFRQKQHRQRIAQMIVENGWYTAEKEQKGGEIIELPAFLKSGKEKVKYFPRVFYRMRNGKIHINVEIPMGRFQEQFLNLHEKLETGIFCELIEDEMHEFYKEYVFLYDVICNRIGIEDVKVERGRILLMNGLWWEFDALPHALIVGGTGGGKTYFILTLIEALLKSGAVLTVLDPKRADLSDLAAVMPNVYYDVNDMIRELNIFYEEMLDRTEVIKQMPDYRTGVNYAYVGLEPHFLIFDEYVAFMEMVGRKREEVLAVMRKVAMLGRQAGYFLILACQRPDAKYFADGMRDQFNLRIALGKNSEMGYGMMFGSECRKQFYSKRIRGRGYIDMGTNVITEFYTPLVKKDYDFIENIRGMNLGSTRPYEENDGDSQDVSYDDDF